MAVDTFAAVRAHANATGAPPKLPPVPTQQYQVGTAWDSKADPKGPGIPGTLWATTKSGHVVDLSTGKYINFSTGGGSATSTVAKVEGTPYQVPPSKPPVAPLVKYGPPVPKNLGDTPPAPTLPSAGFDFGQKPSPTTTPDDGYQKALGGIAKATDKVFNTDYSVPYQQVVPDLVKGYQIPNPFGKKGYQPDVKGESKLLGDALAPNYLSAFLPQEIENFKQVYGPQFAAQIMQGLSDRNTLLGYNTGTNEMLSQIPGQVGQTFDNSIGLQSQIDQGIRKSLVGLNPTPTVSAAASQLGPGAPKSQAQELASQARTTFNGGGAVLGGLGDLNASSLAAQKASAVSAAQELPGLNALAGRQALLGSQQLNNAALAKLQTQESKDALTAARQDQSARGKQQGNELGAFKSERSFDAQMIAQQIGIDKTNASDATSVAVHNATARQEAQVTNAANALESIRLSNSAKTLALGQLRYSLSLVKAMYPQKSLAQQTSQGKAIDSFLSQSSGQKVVTYSQFSTKYGKTISVPQPTRDFDSAVHALAVTYFNGNMGAAEQAASGYYNYGQGDRPFDPRMQQVLHAAGQQPTFYSDSSLGAFITTGQAAALTKGFQSFVSTLNQVPFPKDKLVKAGVITQAQADATPSDMVTIWQIPAYGGG